MYKSLKVLIIDEVYSGSNRFMTEEVLHKLNEIGFEVSFEQVDSYLGMKNALSGDSWNIVLFNAENQYLSPIDVINLINHLQTKLPLIIVEEDSKKSRLTEEILLKPYFKGVIKCNILGLSKSIQSLFQQIEAVPVQPMPKRHINDQEELLYVTLSSIGDGVITTDILGQINFINKVAEDMIGYTLQEVIERPLHEVFNIVNKNTREAVESPFQKVMLTGKAVGLKRNTVLLSRNGSEKYISASTAPIRNKNNHIIGVVVVFRDITMIRQSEEALRDSEERYRTLFENASDMIYTHDLSGSITSVNNAAVEATGYTREQLLSMNIDELVAPEYKEKVHQMILNKISKKAEVTRYELEIINKDGVSLMIEVNSHLIYKDEKPDSIQGIARDVSYRKLERITMEQAASASAIAKTL